MQYQLQVAGPAETVMKLVSLMASRRIPGVVLDATATYRLTPTEAPAAQAYFTLQGERHACVRAITLLTGHVGVLRLRLTNAADRAVAPSPMPDWHGQADDEAGSYIGDLGLETRTENALLKAGINNVPRLLRMTASQLRDIPSFGPRCLQDVQEALAKRSLKLRDAG